VIGSLSWFGCWDLMALLMTFFVVSVDLNVVGLDVAEFVPEQFRLLFWCTVGSFIVLDGVAVCRKI
jgi:hypothetical protein